MGELLRYTVAISIVIAIALGACAARPKEPEDPMDGSTAGANAVTLEELEAQHGGR